MKDCVVKFRRWKQEKEIEEAVCDLPQMSVEGRVTRRIRHYARSFGI